MISTSQTRNALPCSTRSSEIFLEECEQLVPTIYGLFVSVPRSVVVKEAVPCFRVHVEFVGLPILLQLLFMLCDLLWSRKLILLTEQPEQGTRQILRIVYWRHRILGSQFLLR